jgi:hypothetical protein
MLSLCVTECIEGGVKTRRKSFSSGPATQLFCRDLLLRSPGIFNFPVALIHPGMGAASRFQHQAGASAME